jgi:hypothetical protein
VPLNDNLFPERKTKIMKTRILMAALLAAFNASAQHIKALYLENNPQAVFMTQMMEKVVFKQSFPDNGARSSFEHKIAVAYNKESLFLKVTTAYPTGTDITKNLTFRDELSNTDYIGVIIDPFGRNADGWGFFVTSAGVQADIKYSQENEFVDWNEVWTSDVSLDSTSWTVSFRIPFNALRIDKRNLDSCHINIVHYGVAKNQQSWFSHIDANKYGFLTQFGRLKGLEKVAPPLNLSLYPFVSLYYNEDKLSGQSKPGAAAGLDLKYVFKGSYSLDISAIPDFRQTTFDNRIYNLSPFEVKFEERRQFFTEGAEIFNKSRFFYSRRIGSTPVQFYNVPDAPANDSLVNNPSNSPILSLVKLVGKNKEGFSFGILNGVVNQTFARYASGSKFKTNPFSNYTSVSLEKQLKNNSYVFLQNNSVLREGNWYKSNTSHMIVQLYDKKNRYGLRAEGAESRYFNDPWPNGQYYRVVAEKVSGRFVAGVEHEYFDEYFDPNDFGYLDRNNKIYTAVSTGLQFNNPFSIFNRVSVSGVYERASFKRLQSREFDRINLKTLLTFRNNAELLIGNYYKPRFERDYFEARTRNRFVKIASMYVPYFEFSTNRNRPFSFNSYSYYTQFNKAPFRYIWEGGFGMNYTGARFRAGYSNFFIYSPAEAGVFLPEGRPVVNGNGTIDFVIRQRTIIQNSVSFRYLINNKIGASLKIRHYWDRVINRQLQYLDKSGELSAQADTAGRLSLTNAGYNTFNWDLLLRWQFAPGSELTFNMQYGLEDLNRNVNNNLFDNYNRLFNTPRALNISLKAIYYINAGRFR